MEIEQILVGSPRCGDRTAQRAVPTNIAIEWVAKEFQLPQNAAEQVAAYFADAYRSLGAIPVTANAGARALLR